MPIFYNPNRKKGLFFIPSGATGGERLAIQYSATSFCEDGTDPIPGITGETGGNFSSTTGLVFISTSTGQVDLSASTPGTYVVTYTAPSSDTATTSITINALDNAAFAYSASSYEPTDADPTPTITGLTGGTFSAGIGLVFVDSGTNTGSSTGQIDLSASTIASYTITYDTTSSGSSVCPNTSTQSVEVAVAGIANNYSMNFDGSNDYLDLGTYTQGTGLALNADMTISAWIKTSNLSSTQVIICNLNSGASSGGYCIEMNRQANGQYGILYNGATVGLQGSTILSSNTWYHIVMTRTGTSGNWSYNLYLNGNADGSATNVAQNFGNGSIAIGRFGAYNGGYFNGSIDEVGIWNIALTSTQVSQIYSATSTNLTKDLTTVSGSNLIYFNRMGD